MANGKKYLDYTGLSHFWSKIKAELDNKVTVVSGKGLSTEDFTTDEKTKLGNISPNAEVNQNAFSSVKVGTTTIASGSKTATLELAAGEGVALTPDATGKKVTIKMSGAGTVTGGTVTNSNISGGTISGSTLSGTISNSGTISGGTISGSTLSGTISGAVNSTIDLKDVSTVLVPTATAGDNTTKAASTAFVKKAVDDAVSTINGTTGGLNTRLTGAETDIDNLQGAINKLNDADTVQGSVKHTVATEIAKIVNDNNNGSIDTLNEIAAWIVNDTTGAASMQSDISALKTGMTEFNNVKGDIGHVTSVANHYSPTENSGSALNASAVTATDVASSNINVITGLKRDAKGHVVGVVSGTIKATNTTYTASGGITLSGTNFTNSGVRSVATGTANGTISVNTNGTAANVSVYGLKSAAYTESSAYAPASHDHTSITGKAATAGTADKVANAFTVSIGTNTTEGTGKYTFNGSAAKTLNIVAGNNVTLTPAAGKLTIAATDTIYTHPSHAAKSSGLYKITVDSLGHVSAATAVVKSDITALGIPAQDTTYTAATTANDGLMSTTHVTNLNNVMTICDNLASNAATTAITNAEIDNIIAGTVS